MTVVVVQPKGGAGKTPTTICLSAAFGAHRGGYVVGWDDNETRGTLAVRVTNPDDQRTTVWDLLGDLPAFERFDARVGDLSHYVRLQPDSHFDALVSDDNPGNMAQIGEDEFHRLHRVLQRFYRLIVVDTGNNVRSPNWQAAVNAADLVVVVSTYQRDVGYSGSWVLDHLAQTGREELARNAITVLSAADPTTDKSVREQLIAHFSARTRAVAEIPYDPAARARRPDPLARPRNADPYGLDDGRRARRRRAGRAGPACPRQPAVAPRVARYREGVPTLPTHRPKLLLEIDLTTPPVEVEPDDLLAKLRSRNRPRLRALLRALHEAGDDARVRGVVVKVGGSGAALGHRAGDPRRAAGVREERQAGRGVGRDAGRRQRHGRLRAGHRVPRDLAAAHRARSACSGSRPRRRSCAAPSTSSASSRSWTSATSTRARPTAS